MKNEQLKNYKIFENLNDDQIDKFHSAIKKEKIDSGNKFIVEGDEGNSIYLLLKGEAEINPVSYTHLTLPTKRIV